MKRSVPLLILAIFCLGILGGRAVQFHHQLQKNTSTQRGNFPSLLAYDDSSDPLDETEDVITPSGDLAFSPEHCGHDLAAWDWATPTSRRQDNRRGLGCGGLPA